MKKITFTMLRKTYILVSALLLTLNLNAKPKPDTRLYEMRIYYPAPGKYAAIVDRFRQYSTKLLEKHGMTNVGYWTPIDTNRKELIYILAHRDMAARDASWKAFFDDPAWKEVVAKTEANGKLVQKVDVIYLNRTDFSDDVRKSKKGDRVFELRTYTATPGHLSDILARFRNHTTKLFEKHGMTNVAYWTTVEKDAATQSKLVYILAHKSQEAGKASFDAFRKDPDWIKVRDESERNGKIVEKVESLYLNATDYSEIQ